MKHFTLERERESNSKLQTPNSKLQSPISKRHAAMSFPCSETITMEVDEQNKPNPLGTSATATQTNSITPMNKHHQYEEEKKEEKEQLFPPGYRFCPYDNELIFYYLKKKILNLPLPHNKIKDVNLYAHNPEHLAGCFFSSLSMYTYIHIGI